MYNMHDDDADTSDNDDDNYDVQENLVGGGFKLNRCPGHNDQHDDDADDDADIVVDDQYLV